MNSSAAFLSPSVAAKRLGISVKALRVYEQHGLIAPIRTAAGWRTYGPEQMRRASEIAALRALGFSLAQITRVLQSDHLTLKTALTVHQATLEEQIQDLVATLGKVRGLREDLMDRQAPQPDGLAQVPTSVPELRVAFNLPWPWGGERFELRAIGPLNYITGPLGSGKTRLAMHLADTLSNAVFLGLDRLTDYTTVKLASRTVCSRVDQALACLVERGAAPSDALIILVTALEGDDPSGLIIDMPEQGLDKATQVALISRLRERGPKARPLFLLTRSNAILDLDAVGTRELIVYCPANHSVPLRVAPYPGAHGYEALASCLAPPEVRARTEGVMAWRPGIA
ncbi:MerR family transcriptional regulator [Hyphomicrobium sp. CS1GBMeth3]|uniref:MerR family transcriptional regulator n=1 Tax=Hyphomicrobium sp. CS1GBMeth3 TaxID=1892845 RepID=UPI0009310A5D|nr:MerR family transcriptional regulator [Hyphomicrobium sp. CS1GBMeth3]